MTLALDTAQFKLERFQIFNWGTIHGRVDIPVSAKSHLIVGPSGSGKSTILDANANLLTPPKWVRFNVAAQSDEKANDRNVMSYLRGAWGEKSTETGESAQQYLRPGTTWSAMAQTYRNAFGKSVTLAQVFWIRGSSTSRADIKRMYLVLERDFELSEIQPFAAGDFDTKKLRAIEGVSVHDEFSGYRERFTRLLGIENESALKLLHKTQFAKNMGDINDFLRDFMLETPNTFSIADTLVEQFQQLSEAHATVVQARLQIETLTPAKIAFQVMKDTKNVQDQLHKIFESLPAFIAQKRRALLETREAEILSEIQALEDQSKDLEQASAQAREDLSLLEIKRSGKSDAALSRAEANIQAQHRTIREAEMNTPMVEALVSALGVAQPGSSEEFSALKAKCVSHIQSASVTAAKLQQKRDDLNFKQRAKTQELAQVKEELDRLGSHRSNISLRMQQVRDMICDGTGFTAEDLPFAGELLDVRDSAKATWQGAIERVMRSFAETILVPEDAYEAVSSFVNRTHMRGRVRYQRTHIQARPNPATAANPLYEKLVYADHPLQSWLKAEVQSRFDYDCVSSDSEFRNSRRAVTANGQIKHNASSHEKNDSTRVDDASQWVLGFGDSGAKKDILLRKVQSTQHDLSTLNAELKAADGALVNEMQTIKLMERVVEWDWSQVDLVGAKERLQTLEAQAAELKAEANLEELDNEIAAAKHKANAAHKAYTATEALLAAKQQQIQQLVDKNSALDSELMEPLNADIEAELVSICANETSSITLDNVDEINSRVIQALGRRDKELESTLANQKQVIEMKFTDFIRQWPAKTTHLDATVASAEGFLELLQTLETDGLARFESRFLALLSEQGTQELMRLHTQLDSERKDIRRRMESVNESLGTAEYNPGTNLVIETRDRQLPEVTEFKNHLKGIFTGALGVDSTEQAEARFELLNSLVKKLGSSETADRNWRNVVLDVRQHVDFLIREMDKEGKEVEVYRSGSGKSGGQKQKLTATCLAAALRYQLSGQTSGLPSFSTVFMDEAFDKADEEFTEVAVNIFKTFGFQLVVATPMKGVMTLEPFIGGASLVSIVDRKQTTIMDVLYDDGAQKLKFSEEQRREAEELAAA